MYEGTDPTTWIRTNVLLKSTPDHDLDLKTKFSQIKTFTAC